jgi:transcription-repair coupling factor (superfamily II helicase)
VILARAAFRIAEQLTSQDLVCLTDDEQQADSLAAMVRALMPQSPVIFLPSSDALPGDSAPPSPSNSGMRVAALRALRQAQQAEGRVPTALILSGEAAARRYPPPAAFDSAPPLLAPGDPLDMAMFAATVAELGYIDDDRVDEPGEVALRGDVIDIYPADAGSPARIEIVDGRVTAIRTFDPVTQRTVDDIAALEIGRATEPDLGDAVTILDHLSPSQLMMTPKADRRRQRFVDLAKDSVKRTGRPLDAIDDGRWAEATAPWTLTTFDDDSMPVPRFAEARSPLAALAKIRRAAARRRSRPRPCRSPARPAVPARQDLETPQARPARPRRSGRDHGTLRVAGRQRTIEHRSVRHPSGRHPDFRHSDV